MYPWLNQKLVNLADLPPQTHRKNNSWRRTYYAIMGLMALCALSLIWHTAPEEHKNHIKQVLTIKQKSFVCPNDKVCVSRARSVSALDLMSNVESGLNEDREEVPRIIHQCWFGNKSMTALSARLSNTWRTNHPTWKHVLWSDVDNRQLVKLHYPWFLAAYDALDLPIKRADAVRNLYMHKFGGIYADLDVESLRPIDPLLKEGFEKDDFWNSKHALFGSMGPDKSFAHSIPNDWMASSAGHPFFLLPIFSILTQGVNSSNADGPEAITGPVALRNAILRFQKGYPANKIELFATASGLGLEIQEDHLHVKVYNETSIHPFDWNTKDTKQALYCFAHRSTFNPSLCKEQLRPLQKNGYTVAYWTHAWE